MHLIYSLFFILFLLPSCSGDSKEASIPVPNNVNTVKESSIGNLAIPDNRFSNTYQVLVFGNSHVIGLDKLIKSLIMAGNPFAKVEVFNAGGGFLDDSFSQEHRTNLLENKPWTHIILQGQKYSQSGSRTYPTISAQSWIDKAKKLGVTPILFPEHPQRGKTTEGKRVHSIHTEIAAKQKSCVAPVGLAWDSVITNSPKLPLHSSDGNHAAILGKLLTAFVFYQVITGESADLLPFNKNLAGDETTQQLLRQFASETIQSNQACIF